MDEKKRGLGAGLSALALLATSAVALAQTAPPPTPPATDAGPSAPSTPSVPPSAAPPAPTAPPAPVPPTAAPPATPPPPAPSAAAPPPTSAPRAPKPAVSPSSALVHVYSSYPDSVLELRSSVDENDWHPACSAPCDRVLKVENMDARVVAPGMTTSNVFRIEPGQGTASFKVSGGSDGSRRLGTYALIAGIPLTLTGMAMFGYGQVDDNSGLRTAGIVTLAVGGVIVLGSLPLLANGSTRVRDSRGKMIAKSWSPPRF